MVDVDRLRLTAAALSSKGEAEKLVAGAQKLVEALRHLPPVLTPAAVEADLKDLATRLDWEKGDDVPLRTRLGVIARQLSRMRRLKRPGDAPLPADLAKDVADLLRTASAIGLFLVPVGELEDWLAGYGIEASREKSKSAWVNEAIGRIREKRAQPDDAWAFMREVGSFLGAESRRP